MNNKDDIIWEKIKQLPKATTAQIIEKIEYDIKSDDYIRGNYDV